LIIDIIGLLELVHIGAEAVAAIQDVLALIEPDEMPEYATLTLEEKTALLKKCTKIVANLDLNLACYPLGYATTILFDLEGNPVP